MTNHLDRPLKICLLSYRSNPHCGGQGVYLKNLSRGLKAIGHHVEVVSGPPDPMLDADIPVYRLPCLDLYNPDNLFRTPSVAELSDPVNFMEWAGVSTMGFPEPFTFGIRAHRFLRSRLRNYDIVHDNQSLSYGVGAIARRIPTLATIHHPITIDRKIAVRAVRSYWKKLKQLRWFSFIGMQKRVSRNLKRIITVSECARRDIAREFRIPADRFRVVPNGIDTGLFYPIPEIPREPGRIIVTTSADVPLKGLYYLLHAVARVSRSHAIRLVVVGTPKPNGGISRLIRRLGIGDRIVFTGRISNAEFVRQYARAAMAVVASVYEGFGLPAGEAMACGVPLISTTGGALPEVVGNAGMLVPPGNHHALARAITHLLDHPERAAEMGRRGYQRVQQHFTWTRAAEKTAAAYRETIRDYR
ncbi:glycosyltransferase family 4 protein [Desulfosarcina ovata]|uniref:Glycosyl transferase family 1 n=1 Tax=Desulfosarcina ovata subsp. ovata TaxID=2752305 RepID=A0A5K8AJP6_9BACT|nr:glycosyltransferase family 4 protein [Desulfosarcina ovata]BBO92901.1 glycosyl transferase family 1 [Desulfosarcina ovata subsp. ovata]